MQDFSGKNILLGICGGVAAYKSAFLARELMHLGANVRVVMTAHAQAFISPLLMQALTTHAVHTELMDEEAERGMGHIELAKWADFFLIAPATANTITKCAHGIADDLLTTLFLAVTCPVIFCPAMNQAMWHHPATQKNLKKLHEYGVQWIGPAMGAQACGDVGAGRLVEPQEIIEGLRVLNLQQCLKGARVLITAGPTQEPLDPVRYLTNHSSGKMGYAMARAAQAAGAEVVLISGPTALTAPEGVVRVSVTTAQEMHDAVLERLKPNDIFIATAAVADFSVENQMTHKIKKHEHVLSTIKLIPNPDILSAVVAQNKTRYVIGFAAETQDVLAYAKEKKLRKGVDMMIANQVGRGLAFNQNENQVTIIMDENIVSFPLQHKTRLAREIIALLANQLKHCDEIKKEHYERID